MRLRSITQRIPLNRLVLIVLILGIIPSCHVGRFFVYNFADVRDYKKFPSREIKASSKPFYFHEAAGLNKLKLPAEVQRNNKTLSFDRGLKKSGTYAFIIIRNDSVLYEWYKPGFEQDRIHTGFSMTKSFVSALIGIAIKEGKIKSTNEPITNYIDFLPKEEFQKVTIQHLLDMQSGIKFNESYFNPFGDIAKYYYGTHLKKYLSKLSLESEPGREFRYISVNTQLLTLILENVTGQKVTRYLQEKIWEPLGMAYDATWSLDSKKGDTEKGFCCLNGRAKDFAKLGRLYLNKGNWNGKQILTADWVDQSVNFKTAKNNFVYSNQFWHTRRISPLKDSSLINEPFAVYYPKIKGHPILYSASGDYFAQGFLGQYVYVSPKNKIIIVRLAKKEGGVIWPMVMREIAEKN